MNFDKLMSVVSRVFVFGSFVLIALGMIEYGANVLGRSVIHEAHLPGHLIELGAALTVIVIALLLRQIRDQLRQR
jgi:hypothetical protein